MNQDELKLIGYYVLVLLAEKGDISLLSDDQRIELRELLKTLLDEITKEPVTVSMPDSWGDIRASSKIR